jgi:AraC family transcriptional regulator
MAAPQDAVVIPSAESNTPRRCTLSDLILHGVEVIRAGQVEPLLNVRPRLSSDGAQWGGIALEDHTIPACLVPRHEHREHFLHVVLSGGGKYEVNTGGQTLPFTARPGTTFVLPRGTVDEVMWAGPTHRIAVAIHPRLLTNALDETAHETDIELTEHWDLIDPHINALLLEMAADLNDGSPAGQIYGESLGNALAVYLLKRYAVRSQSPVVYKGGLPEYRLKRVLDYIGDNLAENLSLSHLSQVAGMSPHYFSELFTQSTGRAPHSYVLWRRIERAKLHLLDPKLSIIEAGLDVGFQNPSHFARMFRKLVGTTPSKFRAETRLGGHSKA